MNKKDLIILTLIMLVIVLIIFSSIQFYLFNKVNNNLKKQLPDEYNIIIIDDENLTSQENVYQQTQTIKSRLDICEYNSDCIIVPYSHCCGTTKKAINKIYLTEYNNNPDWQKFDDPDICMAMGACLDDSEVKDAECVNKRCRLIYPNEIK